MKKLRTFTQYPLHLANCHVPEINGEKNKLFVYKKLTECASKISLVGIRWHSESKGMSTGGSLVSHTVYVMYADVIAFSKSSSSVVGPAEEQIELKIIFETLNKLSCKEEKPINVVAKVAGKG